MAERGWRAAVGALAASAVAIALWPNAAHAEKVVDRKVAIVLLDGMSIQDWHRSAGGALRTIMTTGAVGVLHTAPASGNPTTAAREIGANPAHEVRALRTGGTRAGVGEAFTREGRNVAIFGTAAATPAGLRAYGLVGGDTARAPAPMRAYRIPDATSPIGARTDVQAMAIEIARAAPSAGLIVADVADGSLLDAALADDPVLRERWIARALSRADVVITAARTAVGEDGVVFVASAPGPRAREARLEEDLAVGETVSDVRGDHLGVVAMSGPGDGALTSATTGVLGLVSLIDLAPTITSVAGIPPDPSMVGAVIDTVRDTDAVGRARRLDRDLAAAARARPEVALAVFGALAFAALITALLFLARRGRAPRGSAPLHLRDLALVVFAAVCCAPLAVLLDDGWRGAAVAAITAVVARMAIGARWCVPVLASLGLAPLVWHLLDPVAVATTPIGGARAFALAPGIDPALLGCALAALLVIFGSLADARPRLSVRLRVGGALAAGAAVVVLSDDLRAIAPVGVALAWFLARDLGWPLVRTFVAIGSLGTLATAAIFALDGGAPVYPRDLAVWIGDHGARLDIVGVGALAGLPLVLAWWRRRDEVGRAAFGSPGLRAAIGGVVVAALVIAIAYPGGATGAAWTLLPVVAVGGALLTGSRSGPDANDLGRPRQG